MSQKSIGMIYSKKATFNEEGQWLNNNKYDYFEAPEILMGTLPPEDFVMKMITTYNEQEGVTQFPTFIHKRELELMDATQLVIHMIKLHQGDLLEGKEFIFIINKKDTEEVEEEDVLIVTAEFNTGYGPGEIDAVYEEVTGITKKFMLTLMEN